MPACYWRFYTQLPAARPWAAVRACSAMCLPLAPTSPTSALLLRKPTLMTCWPRPVPPSKTSLAEPACALHILRAQHNHKLIGRRTLVLLISDGLDTGEPEALAQELDWLRRRTGRLLWLNPLLRFEGYAPLAQGASVLNRYAHGSLAVHNLSKLEDLAASVAGVLRR
jgi:hypothetical protein